MEKFLDSLPDRDARKVIWTLRLVERMEMVPERYFKKLSGTDALWEIRIRAPGGSYRLLGFFDNPTRFVLTNGFSKKRQAVPYREIEVALNRKAIFTRRKSDL